jgi:hypothetical protein
MERRTIQQRLSKAGTCVAALAAVALIVGGTAAHADGPGQVMFINTATGATEGASIDPFGRLSGVVGNVLENSQGLINKSVFVPTTDGILAYNPVSGGAVAIQQQPFLSGIVSGTIGASAGWVGIAAIDSHMLFIGNGVLAVTSLNPNMSTTQTDTETGEPSWTNLLATQTCYMFYNNATGAIAAGETLTNGLYNQDDTGNAGLTRASLFGVTGDLVMIDSPAQGAYKVLALNARANGTIFGCKIAAGAGGAFPGFFDHVVSIAGSLVWYNSSTGAFITGTLQTPISGIASWKQAATGTIGKGFNQVATAGRYAAFYNTTSGNLLVFGINATGGLVRTAIYNTKADGFYDTMLVTTH